MSKPKLLFLMSGSISAYKSCAVLSALVQKGFEVQVVASASALRFVGDVTLEALSHRPVLMSSFESGHLMDHIHLVDWCDAAVLCPATARTLTALAHGTAVDLLGDLFLAFDFQKPFLIFPAMNDRMWNHPATKLAVERLSSWGLRVYSPVRGALACGREGTGRLMEPEDVVFEIEASLSSFEPQSKRNVLISSGGTRESIDRVRYIGNVSTGETGAFVTEALLKRGNQVTLLYGEGAALPCSLSERESLIQRGRLKLVSFSHSRSLQGILKEELERSLFDAVIHMAAVSDYSVASVSCDGGFREITETGKMSSEFERVSLNLVRNNKILPCLRDYSKNPEIRVVGFKLTSGASEDERIDAVKKIFERGGVDYVVQNDLSEKGEMKHRATLYDRNMNRVREASTKSELAQMLEEVL